MGRRCGSICSWKFSAASASSAQLGLGAAAVTSAGSIDGCEILARHVHDKRLEAPIVFTNFLGNYSNNLLSLAPPLEKQF